MRCRQEALQQPEVLRLLVCRLPNVVRRPYLGEILERATPKQYYNGFDCDRIGFIQRLPQQW